MHIKKIAVTQENRIYPVEDLNISMSLTEGGIDREQLLTLGNEAKILHTTTQHKLLFCDATFKDNYDRMKRGPAVIIPKDVGFIIAEIGLTKDHVVIDAGAGTGGMTCQLAVLCKHVYSYDVEAKHIKIVKENCKRLDLDNVTIEEADIYTLEPPKNVDAVILDVPEPVKAIGTAKKALKQGGYVVFYTPHITQAQEVVLALGEDFKYLTTIELIQRRWEVDEKRLRPKHAMLGHTAFLTIARKFQR
jgi:tRNA (adenine57-N1/adenine58-N1)-methyltransferase catalytic subunit